MILSHHGEYAFGSPKLPMTLEAIALYCLDNLDAKINSFHQLMKEDPNIDSPWTVYQPNIERKLFKGAVKQKLNFLVPTLRRGNAIPRRSGVAEVLKVCRLI